MSQELIIGGRYEIIEEIGKGGMAIVYKARCQVLNRFVALKVLRPEFRNDKDFVERFKVEAQSAGGLSHPNIVSIYDVGQTENLNYIVMEYVEGVTLKQYIEAKGVLAWKEAVDYAAQICAGLEHAHKKGIVHRDIKPQNIIITREGTAKITDFGIAKATNAATIEMGASNMGSVHYFSPEQARGGYVDCKSDIYSLGVMLYEMVTGKVPFDGDNLVTIAMQHLENAPLAPTKLNPSIPKSLEAIIGKAMCKEKTGRYEDVTKMLIDLKKVYIGTPVSFSDGKDPGDTVLIPINLDKSKKDTRTKEYDKEERAYKENDLLDYGKKEKKRMSKKDRNSIIAGIVCGVLLVGILSFVFYQVFLGGGVGEIEIPDISGKTVEEVTEMFKDTKLKIEVVREEKSDSVDAGDIISQDPKAKEIVKENATVKVVVSLGSDGTPLPNLENMTEAEAKSTLDALGINYTTTIEESEDVEEGLVIRQFPTAKTMLKKTDTVTIYVSKGAGVKVVAVPDLRGMTQSAARKMLESMNLELGKVYFVTSQKPEGTVVEQQPQREIVVAEGTAIDIRISKAGGSTSTNDEPSGETVGEGSNSGTTIRPVPNTLE